MFLVLAFLVLVAVIAYGAWERAWENRQRYLSVPVILVLMLLIVVYARQSSQDGGGDNAPLLLAISADVSLSMGTVPEPSLREGVGTRLERAQAVLLPLLSSLGAAGRPVMVSVSAFTAKAETVLAWDDELSLAQEIVEFVLSTGLLTEAGSDLGVALDGVVPLFESLPDEYDNPDYPKYLIVVSDGEQTAGREMSETALARLRELGVRVIALQVGLEDIQEGLPVYDDDGEFVGFEEVSGQIFSVPNPEIMRIISGADEGRGIFVRAETGDPVGTITDFIGLQTDSGVINTRRVAAILLLWAGVAFILLRRF